MSIKTFIAKQVQEIENGQARTRGNQCASVFRDGDRLYSFGYHYPLLLQVETQDGRKLWVVNDTGYSNSTAKHIGHASQHADISAPIASGHGWASRTVTAEDVKNAIGARIEKLREQLEKKRQGTYVYANLEYRHERACGDYFKLTGVHY